MSLDVSYDEFCSALFNGEFESSVLNISDREREAERRSDVLAMYHFHTSTVSPIYHPHVQTDCGHCSVLFTPVVCGQGVKGAFRVSAQ